MESTDSVAHRRVTGSGTPARAAAGAASWRFPRIAVSGEETLQVTEPEFFRRNPELRELVRRAAAAGVGEVSCLVWAEGVLWRALVEGADAGGGRRPAAAVSVVAVDPPAGMTRREIEVANCLAGGLSNPEIAAALGCSRSTVGTHVERILVKLGVRTRAGVAAAVVAEQLWLFPLPAPGLELPRRLGFLDPEGAAPAPAAPAPPRRRPALIVQILPDDPSRRHETESMRRGAALAVAKLNESGGSAGRGVRQLTTRVSAAGLNHAVQEAQRAGADGILLGNFPAADAHAALALAGESRTPLLHSMVAQSLSDAVNGSFARLGNTFQVCATESAYVPGFVRTLAALQAEGSWAPESRSVAVLVRDRIRADEIRDEIERAGWSLDVYLPFREAVTNWPALFADLERTRPAAVFLSLFSEDDLRLALEGLRALELRPLVYTSWVPTVPGFSERLGPLAEGLLWSTVIGAYPNPASAQFTRAYATEFGGQAGSGGSVVHFDMVNLLAGAWSGSSAPWRFDEVNANLRERVFRGVAGPYFFGGAGQRALVTPDDTPDASIAHAHLVHQVQDGRSVVIFPDALAGRRFRRAREASSGR